MRIFRGDNSIKGNLKKKRGDDKLVVSLILVVIGILLCVFYKAEITAALNQANTSIQGKITDLWGDIVVTN